MTAARAELESLLRARKLDVTLTSSAASQPAGGGAGGTDERVAPTGSPDLDLPLGGGLRRGHLSEVIGARSSGGLSLFLTMAAAATARGEVVALVDTHDRFDPASADAAGVDLSRLLWVRESGNADRAVKALNLVLQAGGFGLVALDLADLRGPALRQFPHTTWLRLARIAEGSQTVALLLAAEHVARSPGGVSILLERQGTAAAVAWAGTTARSRRLSGLTIRPRIVSARAGIDMVPGRGIRTSAG